MRLRELLNYDNIVIQCHDNPDADALASGFGVYEYLSYNGKTPRFVYAGKNIIKKSNLVLMKEKLNIPIEHVDALDMPELLITVDCQYGGGNVTLFAAQNVAVIDHHRVTSELPSLKCVKSDMGSCSTVVWDLLRDEGYDVNKNKKLATALYYGLYTDTGEFSEIIHPLDRDLRDEAVFDKAIFAKFRNANMSLEELEIAGTALIGRDYIEEYRLAIVKAGACDPNVLGIISDFVLEVDVIDTCMVFSVLEDGVKLSFRSCIKEVSASEMAQEVCRDIGSGGGHYYKAGGFIPMELLTDNYVELCKKKGLNPRLQRAADGRGDRPSDTGIKTYLESRLIEYFEDTHILYGDDLDLRKFKCVQYKNRELPMGYVIAKDIVPVGSCLVIRTAQRDEHVQVEDDTVIVINADGEVKAVTYGFINNNCRVYPEWRFSVDRDKYAPKFKNKNTDELLDALDHARVCIQASFDTTKATVLRHKVKLFKTHDDSCYVSGKPGDILVIQSDNRNEVYMINKKDFEKTHTDVKAIIFDLDGTLLYTLEDLKRAVNYALEQHGMKARTIEEIRSFVGNGVRLLVERAVGSNVDSEILEAVFSDFMAYYDKHCNDNTRPYDGILDLLKELKERGIKMAIVSNKIDSAVKSLDKLYFSEYMTAAIGETEQIKRKPAPDMVLKALSELGVSPDEAIYVGDSEVDIKTAQNAGLESISVTWGFRDEKFLHKNGAERLIDSPVQLLRFV